MGKTVTALSIGLPLLQLLSTAAAFAGSGTTTDQTDLRNSQSQQAVPAKGEVTLKLQRTHRFGDSRVVMTGERFRVRGVVKPYVKDQSVVVRVYRDGRKISTRRERVTKIKGVSVGRFVTGISSSRPGRINITATHRKTKEQERFTAKPATVTAFSPVTKFGERSLAVRVLQAKLTKLRYAVSLSGSYDSATGRAVLAYRKVNGMQRTQSAGRAIFSRILRGTGRFVPKYPRHGRHVEADISRQILALINPGGKVYRIYHTSSGAPATPTVLGSYRFYRKSPGTNAKGMVHSAYFIRGYAIHGYISVPPYNASHGCLRVPIPNARSIFDWVRLGQRIDVYR